MKSTDKFVLVLVASLSLLFAGCGGGGSSSSNEVLPGENGETTVESCPQGQTGTPPNCVTPGPTPAQMADEATRVAEAIGAKDNDLETIVQEVTEGDRGWPERVTMIDGGNVKYSQATRTSQRFTAGKAPIRLSRMSGMTWERTGMDEGKETLVSYTNQQKSKAAGFEEYYKPPSASTFDGSTTVEIKGFAWPVWPTGVTVANHAEYSNIPVLTLGTTANSKTLGYIKASVLPTGKSTDRTFGAAGKEEKFSGTFQGVPGEFSCEGCKLGTGSDGKLTSLSAELKFTPRVIDNPDPIPDSESPDKVVAGELDGLLTDADYLDFGYWLSEVEGGDGPVYQVTTFARGKKIIDMTSYSITGQATYAGPATGLFVKKTEQADGSFKPTSSGQFKASAKLTAYFGTHNEHATSLDNMISGTISDFRDSDGDLISAAWKAELSETALNGVNIRGDATGDGSWAAKFYGSPGTATNPGPGSVAGTFDAHFPNGHAAGAFGATKQKQ